MKTFPFASLLLVGFLVVIHGAGAEELGFFGQLPAPGKNWTIKSKGNGGDLNWSWITYSNADSGDLLSFASRKMEAGEQTDLLSLSDSASEIFCPLGYFVHDDANKKSPKSATAWPIRRSVVSIDLIDSERNKKISHDALEYTFIEEFEGGEGNRMGHGYAMIFDGILIFVQNTSTKPITDDLARTMASDLIYIHSRIEQKAPISPSEDTVHP